MSKKLSEQELYYRLKAKGARLEALDITGVRVIDISHAKDLGNKSWGHIDALTRFSIEMVGGGEYKSRNTVTISSEYKKAKKEVIIEKKSRKWHSNADLPKYHDFNGNKFMCSEFNQLDVINNTQTKFNTRIFTKNNDERKLLKKIKANLSIPFNNETVLQWNADNPTPLMPINKLQLSHKDKKNG